MPTFDAMKDVLIALYRSSIDVMESIPEHPSECTKEESDRYTAACLDYSVKIEQAIDMGRCATEQADGGVTMTPAYCPEHPESPVEKSWCRTQYVLNGLPAGNGIDGPTTYRCSVCQRELDVATRDLVTITERK